MEYIRSHVEADIERARRRYGLDYSELFGMVLREYIDLAQYAPDVDAAVISAANMGVAVERTLNRPGENAARLNDTIHCILPIYYMFEQGDDDGILELRRYVSHLITRYGSREGD